MSRLLRSIILATAGWLALTAAPPAQPTFAAATNPQASPAYQPRVQAAAADHRRQSDIPVPPLLPDMIALPAWDLRIQHAGHTRRLRFSTGLANLGVGPTEVRPDRVKKCPKGERHASQLIYRDVDRSGGYNRDTDTTFYRNPAGCMIFHPAHNHWHWEPAARYLLWRPHHAHIIVRARKTSFCMRDSARVPVRYGSYRTRQTYGDCSRDTPQGITRGWEDVYGYYLEGQALKLPPRIRNGVYCLGIRVDPRRYLDETDDSNNLSVRSFRLRGDHVEYLARKGCRPS